MKPATARLELARTLYRERAVRRVAEAFAETAEITITATRSALVLRVRPRGRGSAATLADELANHVLAATIEESRR